VVSGRLFLQEHAMIRAVACLLVALTASAGAQQPVLSPRDSVTLVIDSSSAISVSYGRPSMRGRTIMGGLVPFEKVWRTGANMATHLRASFDMMFGGMPIPRGAYTIYTVPGPARWKVIINNQTGQWGTQYDQRQDRARITTTPRTLSVPVDTFRISLAAAGRSGGVLRLAWETTLIEIPFERNDRIHPVSPLDSSTITLNGKNLKVRYSRPFIRGRDIWGTLVPFDSVWRTGANAVTALSSEGEIIIGGVTVPRGTYSLYSIPTDKGMTLLVNRQLPGSEPDYRPALDVARIPMQMTRSTSAVDPLKISWKRRTATSCILQIGWADRVFSTPVTLR